MTNTFSNHLAGEVSPYLLQHAHNPVDWHPWNELTLSKAKDENRLMVISIGYAACHWCHVMEKESFEDEEVAAVMNADYISVKVDREERPDVDQVYMNAAYVVTGRGGWPLNVISLPDGRPVYAGTYFRKSDWLNVLNHFAMRFKADPAGLTRQAEEIHSEIKRLDSASPARTPLIKNPEELDKLFREWTRILDFSEGGTRGAPKFPMPSNLEFLLHYGILAKNPEALRAVELTLDKMSAGGIFDHVGGGFCRYSVDDRWHVPHFEKMLYDNAQLVSIYSKAFRFFGKSRYARVVRSTLDFTGRELTSPEGLFYSSLDADSEGIEGEYYTWKAAEIDQHLGDNAGLFKDYFCVTDEGNWEEGRNVLHISEEDLRLKYSMSNEQIKTIIKESIDVLFKERRKRVSPALDDKVITGWNALMITGYVDAYKALGDENFLNRAVNAAMKFKMLLDHDNQLFRLYRKPETGNQASGIRHQNAFLDDYAALIRAFLDLYQATFGNEWLGCAEKMIDHAVSRYFDSASGLFFFTSDNDPALIDRKKELSDNVIPGSNSMMAMNLFIFGQVTGKKKWSALAQGMVEKMTSRIFSSPSFHGNWSVLLANVLVPPYEIAIVGKDCRNFLRDFNASYRPDFLFYGGLTEEGNEMLRGKEVRGKTMVYVCRENTCSEPYDSPGKALSYLKQGPEDG